MKNLLITFWRFPWIRTFAIVAVMSLAGAYAMDRLDVGVGHNASIEQAHAQDDKKAEIARAKAELALAEEALKKVTAEEPKNNRTIEEKSKAVAAAEKKLNDLTGGSSNNFTDLGAKLQEALSGGASVMAKIAVFLMKIIGAFLMFMLYWMSDLMDNTFILDGGMGEKLQVIWLFVRNMVNILFAIGLVVVAFINVIGFGGGEGNYDLKKFIPKMALALIAVNFTFLAARVVLDVNNVLTTAVFSLPQNVPDLGQYTAADTAPLKMYAKYNCSLDKATLKEKEKDLPQGETGALASKNETGQYAQGKPIGNFFDICVADIAESKKITSAMNPSNPDGTIDLSQQKVNKNNFVWVMATRYQGIQNIAKVPLEAKDWEALITNSNFAIIFAIIYAVAYLAMFIVLLVRVVVLWICIALSPLIAAEILFPDLMSGLKIGDKDLKSTFLDHAFVPLKMAVPMAIGFIMISQMSLVTGGGFSGEILLTGGEFTRDGSFQRILYGIASVALIWIGVFAATNGVQGSQIIESIKGGVEDFGKFIGKLPLQFVPIVPVAGGGNVSLSALLEAGKVLKGIPETKVQEAGRGLVGALGVQGYENYAARNAISTIKDKDSTERFMNLHWKKLQGDDAKKEAMLAIAKAGGDTKLAEFIAGAASTSVVFSNPAWQSFMDGAGKEKLGLNRNSFQGDDTGTSVPKTPQQAFTDSADIIAKIPNLGDIIVTLSEDFKGSKAGIPKPLKPEEFKEYMRDVLSKKSADEFVTIVENNDKLIEAIKSNPDILGSLEGAKQASQIADFLLSGKKFEGEQNNSKLVAALATLSGKRVADIQKSLTKSS